MIARVVRAMGHMEWGGKRLGILESVIFLFDFKKKTLGCVRRKLITITLILVSIPKMNEHD